MFITQNSHKIYTACLSVSLLVLLLACQRGTARPKAAGLAHLGSDLEGTVGEVEEEGAKVAANTIMRLGFDGSLLSSPASAKRSSGRPISEEEETSDDETTDGSTDDECGGLAQDTSDEEEETVSEQTSASESESDSDEVGKRGFVPANNQLESDLDTDSLSDSTDCADES